MFTRAAPNQRTLQRIDPCLLRLSFPLHLSLCVEVQAVASLCVEERAGARL